MLIVGQRGMCGFLGWFSNSQASRTEAFQRRCDASLEAIRHRGPDDGAESEGPGWWMGFRRLSILDLSAAGCQPMRFGGGRFVLTFNGEIYNFQALRSELGALDGASTGDSVVLGSLLAGKPVAEVLPSLRGMFAFSWWDAEARELIAARDRFGIKPLYYHHAADGSLFVSSEIRALIRWLGGGLQVSHAALDAYLRTGSVTAPLTIDARIGCMPPGHLLRWRDGKLVTEAWFKPQWPGPEAWVRDSVEQQKRVREAVLDSVGAHLVADVPVGVFLSGGLDSTLMAAAMRHLGQERVQAFSIGFDAGAGVPDESEVARETAAFLGCEFTARRLTADDLFEELDGYFDRLDQPTGDALNTYLVSKLAARDVKVTLSGLGADEWFAGYNYHRLAAVAAASPFGRRGEGALARLAGALVGKLPPAMAGHPAAKVLLYASGAMGGNPAEWQARARMLFRENEVVQLTGRGPAAAPIPGSMESAAPGSWLHQLLLSETTTYLADTLLRDNDVTSMAHSLELRVPLVDAQIFELAGCLPPEAKLRGGVGKRILREAFADLLPPWVARDTRKKTFTLPLMRWMSRPSWRDRILDTLSSAACKDRGWILPEQSLARAEAFFRDTDGSKRSWRLSQSVWVLFVLESWAQRHAG